MISAIKPIWTGKNFRMEVVRNADPLLAHSGYLVYDDSNRTLGLVKEKKLIGSWSDRKRQAVITFLESEVAHKSSP